MGKSYRYKRGMNKPVEIKERRFNFFLNTHLYVKLKQHAKREGLSMAKYVRNIIFENYRKGKHE